MLPVGLAREAAREAERRIEREREVSDQRAVTRIREAEGTYRAMGGILRVESRLKGIIQFSSNILAKEMYESKSVL